MLEEGRRRGLLGPGPLPPQLEHALAFGQAAGWSSADAERPLALDLGSGGGLPGLVLAALVPASRWVLLDSRRRSGDFLTEATVRLGLEDRVTVLVARAENLGRDPAHRGRYGLVVARGFGPPAVTAECAAPFLLTAGLLVVSEPPAPTAARWPETPLADLGLRLSNKPMLRGAHFVVLEQVRPCPARFPRRTGVPSKRPLFEAGA